MSNYGDRVVWMVVLGFLINSTQACSFSQYPCILNGSHGHLNSPGYPLNKYPNNANISWLVQVTHGHSVKLEFTDVFAIEMEPKCRYDYMLVFDGPTTGSPMIGKYCGSDKPLDIYSSGMEMLVVFISNNEHGSLGFHANYTALKTATNCSVYQTDEENSNIILKDSPGNLLTFFSNKYDKTASTEQCLWRLRAPEGYGIKIIINAIDFVKNISCLQSNFELYEGYNVQGYKMIQRFCRIKVESPIVKYIPGRAAVLRLRVNQWRASDEFTVRYEFLKKDKNKCSTLNNDQENRNIILTGQSGTFSIHNVDVPVEVLLCRWRLTAPTGYQIKVSFLNFKLANDCGKSYVEIFDRENSKGKFCGPRTPWVVFSTGGFLVVKFVAFGKMDDLSRRFVGVYEAVTNATGRCSIINTRQMNLNLQLRENSGVIMTPNYPASYPPKFECIWLITVPKQYRIKLHFVSFDVENHRCTYDYVEVRDGNSSTSPMKTTERLCDSNVPPDLYSSSNQLWITFVSDYSEQKKGFQAFYSAVRPEPGKCSAANTVEENNNISIDEVPGLLTSPNYPQPYPPNIKCTWHITVPSRSRIQVHLYDFKVHPSCLFEFLEIHDGGCSCNTSLGRYCGSNLPSDMFSSGNSITLVFKTSKLAPSRGFKLSYAILKLGPEICSKGNPPFTNDKLIFASNNSGFITSPNYPLPYTRGMQCTWYARAPQGYHVELNFTALNFPTPCDRDYLEVRDGSSSYSPLKGRFCDLQRTSRIYSSGRYLWMRFESKQLTNEVYLGFVVKYRMIKSGNCSKDFDKSWNTNLNLEESMSGSLASPGYPSPYPHDIQCSWKITVPYGYRVQLKFDQISLRGPCSTEYIEVKDGLYSFSKSLGKFCRNEASVRVVSTDRRLLVHFQSGKSSYLGKGFQARFTALINEKNNAGSNLNSFSAGAITVALLVFAGFVLVTLLFIFLFWVVKKKLRRRQNSRPPRDHDLAVIPPMPVPPLDDIPDCLIAEDRPPSYTEAINEEEDQPSGVGDVQTDGDHIESVDEQREIDRGLDNEGFSSDPPSYEDLYGVDPT